MRILIIEDEHYATKRLGSLIKKELPDANILGVIDTVEDAVSWFSSHVEPDLLFLDIQLADGLSFQIFDQVQVKCSIIFTTAYHEYAINAFQVNSIDYLLKPIEEHAFTKAINKWKSFSPESSSMNWRSLTSQINLNSTNYKKRFLIKTGSSYSYIQAVDISYFSSDQGLSFAFDKEGKRYVLDLSLDKLNDVLNPNQFFRINRKYILSIDSISKIHPYFNNRLKIELASSPDEELVVSRDKVKSFKKWVDS